MSEHEARVRFEIQRTLGEGGFGQVFLAKDTSTGKLVAVKVLKNSWDKTARARFRREVEEIGKLSSGRIVRVLARNLDHSPPFYAMPYFRKGSLRDRLNELQKNGMVVTPAHALRLLLGLLEGLELAHRSGIHHRDLKPENILIDDNDALVLTDFGIGEFVHRRSMLLTLGGGLGTPEYCAPEQWQTGDGSSAADIYSLGIILFELMVGHRPRWQAGAASAPSIYDRRVPKAVDALFHKMTGRLDDRISSCEELRREIEAILTSDFGVKSPRGIPWRGIAAAGLILFVSGLLGGGKPTRQRQKRARLRQSRR